MEITKEKLLEGTATIIKDKEFLPTKDYVSPFIEEMSKFTDDFIIRVEEPTQKLITDKNDNTTFNKVWIQAIISKSNDVKDVYNLVYGLDVRTPLYKIFRHQLYNGNPVVFNSDWMTVNEIDDGQFKFDIPTLMSSTDDVASKVKKLQSSFIEEDEIYSILGELSTKALLYEYRHLGGKIKLSSSMPLKAHELVYMDENSPYYVRNELSSIWNYYNAYSSLIKDSSKKDLMSLFEKTWLVSSLFNKYL